MYFATIDCGTTNTRVYLLDSAYRVIGRGQKKVGVRDTVISGSNEILKEGLKEAFENGAKDAGLRLRDLEFAISAGMITSEIGLIDIPHIPGPVGIEELTRNIKVVRDTAVFPIDIPMIFICGIKNSLPEHATYRDIRKTDFMRGEEVQALGLIAGHGDLRYPVMLTILTSHTKFIYIDGRKRIVGGLSTLSGQIHEAIESATSIGKSIKRTSGDTIGENYFDKGVIDAAYDSVHNAGFLRTILMPRFMDVLLDTQWYERELFLNSAITSEDLRTMNDFGLLGFDKYNSFVLVGDKKRSGIYKYLLEEKVKGTPDIKQICEQDEIDRLSIDGAIEVAKKAGYLT
jgi:2-dehydro-3-deoxygalactonokinase